MAVCQFIKLHDVWLWSYSAAKCDNQYSLLTLHSYLRFYVIGSTRSNFHNTTAMVEGETSSKILPYCFELVSVSNYSDPDTSNSKPKTNIRELVLLSDQEDGDEQTRFCSDLRTLCIIIVI